MKEVSQSGELFWQGQTLNGWDDTAEKLLEFCVILNILSNTQAPVINFNKYHERLSLQLSTNPPYNALPASCAKLLSKIILTFLEYLLS